MASSNACERADVEVIASVGWLNLDSLQMGSQWDLTTSKSLSKVARKSCMEVMETHACSSVG